MTPGEAMHNAQLVDVLIAAAVLAAASIGALGTAAGRSFDERHADVPRPLWDQGAMGGHGSTIEADRPPSSPARRRRAVPHVSAR